MSDSNTTGDKVVNQHASWIIDVLKADYVETCTSTRSHISKAQTILTSSSVLTGFLVSSDLFLKSDDISVKVFIALAMVALAVEFLCATFVWRGYRSRLIIPHERQWQWDVLTRDEPESVMHFVDELSNGIAVESKKAKAKSELITRMLWIAISNVVFLLLAFLATAFNDYFFPTKTIG